MPAHHPKLQKPHVAVQRHPHLTHADPLEAMYPDDPAVYHYTYSVEDDYTGAQIYADEARDDQLTHGMYEAATRQRWRTGTNTAPTPGPGEEVCALSLL